MNITLHIEAPGSVGELRIEVTTEQLLFLKELTEEWNRTCTQHAQPYMIVTEDAQTKTQPK